MTEELAGKRVLVLGYGREGRSSFRYLREHLPDADLSVADANTALDAELSPLLPPSKRLLGPDYMQAVPQFDVVMQSPGICLKDSMPLFEHVLLTSQTDLFLKAFRKQCVGVTGTKGKSTTASLVHHLLRESGRDTLFGGNIGLPLFEIASRVRPETVVVLELSCHQLEFVRYSPHIALLLNLYEEHLDHYRDFMAYQLAKYNITRFQEPDDLLVCSAGDGRISALLRRFPPRGEVLRFGDAPLPGWMYSADFPLVGEHNRRNAEAALLAVRRLCAFGDDEAVRQAVSRFHGLPHRLEYVGCAGGIRFYNDSISTIPQAAVAAVAAIGGVGTLMLGGMDRGIDYSPLLPLFRQSAVCNFLFTGQAGRRMMSMIGPVPGKTFLFFEKFEDMVDAAFRLTAPGSACLLAPAAPSYDAFKNFEERGDVFKKLVLLHFNNQTENHA